MEDVVTETPPPSRFFPEDLNTFASSPATHPHPLLLLPPNPNPNPTPTLLIVFISPPSLALLGALPAATPLAAALLLPDLPLSPSPLAGPHPNSLPVYSLPSALLAFAGLPVAPHRARAVARALLGALRPAQVLVLDSIRGGGGFRGRLPADEPLEYKLETAAARRGAAPEAARGVGWLPAGSVAEGLGAAVMAECQMKGVVASMVVTWPEAARPADVAVLRRVAAELGFDLGRAAAVGSGRAGSDLLYA